jgi:large subunit ribosomal protein L33
MGIKGRTDKMVVLACETCKERNYTTVKNKKTTKERMELSKYCPSCKKHTAHKETK